MRECRSAHRNDILWHTDKGMTNHYAVAQVREIYDALELIKKLGDSGESQNLLSVPVIKFGSG